MLTYETKWSRMGAQGGGKMSYGDVIKNRRTALGMNQAALADLVGVSRNTVAGWETGHSRPDL
ncbi:MAG: helix-turn-helix domain-containing protein, partial [Clostridiales bacterium]|nr:helix-turn-helix domain-containing protein [Clostridiales bacterium]